MLYAISNHKGGVGKTTSTINIGAGLARLGKKVLLVDLDPQANLTQSLGLKQPEITIYDNLKGDSILSPIEYKPNISILPSSLDLSAAEIELSAEPGREYILKELLSKIKHKYDHILIDCPPSLGLLTINALTAADYVVIPLQAEYLALRGLAKLTEVIGKIQRRLNPNLLVGAVFLTQYDSRKILNRNVAESVENFFEDKFFQSKIANNVALAEAPSQGQDVFSYNKNCRGAEDYQRLVSEMQAKGVFNNE